MAFDIIGLFVLGLVVCASGRMGLDVVLIGASGLILVGHPTSLILFHFPSLKFSAPTG